LCVHHPAFSERASENPKRKSHKASRVIALTSRARPISDTMGAYRIPMPRLAGPTERNTKPWRNGFQPVDFDSSSGLLLYLHRSRSQSQTYYGDKFFGRLAIKSRVTLETLFLYYYSVKLNSARVILGAVKNSGSGAARTMVVLMKEYSCTLPVKLSTAASTISQALGLLDGIDMVEFETISPSSDLSHTCSSPCGHTPNLVARAWRKRKPGAYTCCLSTGMLSPKYAAAAIHHCSEPAHPHPFRRPSSQSIRDAVVSASTIYEEFVRSSSMLPKRSATAPVTARIAHMTCVDLTIMAKSIVVKSRE
ncbi:hypothetical protein KCU59_g21, partial [Aureobasidium melanogenum]